jgi:hypothetical protein
MAELVDFAEMTKSPKKVFAVTEDLFWYALEVLPPVYAKGCFGMGEAYSGEWFYWFMEIKNVGFYGFLGSQAEAEKAFADFRATKTQAATV